MDTAHEQPSPGDVLITTEIGVHFLSVVPHHHRLSFRELSAAINIATQWANANGGNVWRRVDGEIVRLPLQQAKRRNAN